MNDFILESITYLTNLYEDKIDIIKKQYPNIKDNILEQLKKIDPTTGNKFLIWLVKQYETNYVDLKDLTQIENIKKCLTLYNNESFVKKLSMHNRNILNLNYPEVLHICQGYFNDLNLLLSSKELKDKAFIGETDKWLIYEPMTFEENKVLGSNTSWCTSGSSEGRANFNRYYKTGPLYVFINKKNSKDKYMLHLSSMQFMDSNDETIFNTNKAKEILEDIEVLKFLKTKINKELEHLNKEENIFKDTDSDLYYLNYLGNINNELILDGKNKSYYEQGLKDIIEHINGLGDEIHSEHNSSLVFDKIELIYNSPFKHLLPHKFIRKYENIKEQINKVTKKLNEKFIEITNRYKDNPADFFNYQNMQKISSELYSTRSGYTTGIVYTKIFDIKLINNLLTKYINELPENNNLIKSLFKMYELLKADLSYHIFPSTIFSTFFELAKIKMNLYLSNFFKENPDALKNFELHTYPIVYHSYKDDKNNQLTYNFNLISLEQFNSEKYISDMIHKLDNMNLNDFYDYFIYNKDLNLASLLAKYFKIDKSYLIKEEATVNNYLIIYLMTCIYSQMKKSRHVKTSPEEWINYFISSESFAKEISNKETKLIFNDFNLSNLNLFFNKEINGNDLTILFINSHINKFNTNKTIATLSLDQSTIGSSQKSECNINDNLNVEDINIQNTNLVHLTCNKTDIKIDLPVNRNIKLTSILILSKIKSLNLESTNDDKKDDLNKIHLILKNNGQIEKLYFIDSIRNASFTKLVSYYKSKKLIS